MQAVLDNLTFIPEQMDAQEHISSYIGKRVVLRLGVAVDVDVFDGVAALVASVDAPGIFQVDSVSAMSEEMRINSFTFPIHFYRGFAQFSSSGAKNGAPIVVLRI